MGDDMQDGNNRGWRGWVMAAMWAVILLMAGYTFQTAQAANKALWDKVDAQQGQIHDALQRTAVLEQHIQYQQRQLDRIERGVDNLLRRQ